MPAAQAPDAVDRDHGPELQQRLRSLLTRHTQSEIARKTGFGVARVNHYLKQTSMPAEFCCRLVEGLGINPSWWLTGDGPTYSHEVRADTSDFASKMIGLVEAMEAVAKVKLGALSGRQLAVRELDEALLRYDQLRQSLDARCRPVLEELTVKMRKALMARQFDTMKSLIAIARRLEPLCSDVHLKCWLKEHEAYFSRSQGRDAESLEFRRVAFQLALSVRDEIGDVFLDHAFTYAITLTTEGMGRRAEQVCDSALLFADTQKLSPLAAQLVHFQGWLDVQKGELHEGLKKMGRARLASSERGGSWAAHYIGAQLYAGMIDIDKAAQELDSIMGRAMVLHFAAARGDEKQLGELCRRFVSSEGRYVGDASGKLGVTHALARMATHAHRALRTGDFAVSENFDRIAAPRPKAGFHESLTFLIFSGCIARAARNFTLARQRVDAAERMLERTPPECRVYPITLTMHHRNAILLAADGARRMSSSADRARAFFREWVDKGYLFFQELQSQ